MAITPRTRIALQRDQEAVRVALQKIPVHYQLIIELSYWYEMPTAELAEVLEIDPTTVRTRLFRARKLLLAALEGTGIAEDRVDAAVASLGNEL
jgi:RNA polymerase sigma-70 factor (ECF subfamily)